MWLRGEFPSVSVLIYVVVAVYVVTFVATLVDVTAISAGPITNMALRSDGSVWPGVQAPPMIASAGPSETKQSRDLLELGGARVLVEGVNRVTRHTKAGQTARGSRTGGLVVQEAPIHVSNVAEVDPSGHTSRTAAVTSSSRRSVRARPRRRRERAWTRRCPGRRVSRGARPRRARALPRPRPRGSA